MKSLRYVSDQFGLFCFTHNEEFLPTYITPKTFVLFICTCIQNGRNKVVLMVPDGKIYVCGYDYFMGKLPKCNEKIS